MNISYLSIDHIGLLVDGNLGCFHFLATAMKQDFVWAHYQFWGVYKEVFLKKHTLTKNIHIYWFQELFLECRVKWVMEKLIFH